MSASQAARLAQTESARDDAAQHFRGAALDGQFRRGLDRERQLPLQRLAVARVLLDKGGEVAHPVRQLLLPHGADVLDDGGFDDRSEEHTSELQSRLHLVCRLLLEKKKKK